MRGGTPFPIEARPVACGPEDALAPTLLEHLTKNGGIHYSSNDTRTGLEIEDLAAHEHILFSLLQLDPR
eukprot:8446508-Pyramimonas_sp.AAC.1